MPYLWKIDSSAQKLTRNGIQINLKRPWSQVKNSFKDKIVSEPRKGSKVANSLAWNQTGYKTCIRH